MPVKKDPLPPAGPQLHIDDVFMVDELLSLAEDWATPGATFEIDHLNRYRELCAYFEVDGVSFLYAVQKRKEQVRPHLVPEDENGTFVMSTVQVTPE